MHMIRTTLLITLVMSGIASAKDKKQAFYSYPLNDARIAAAITVGNKAGGRSMSLSLSDSAQNWSRALGSQQVTTGFSLEIYTPFSWIAQNASWKAKKYQTFAREDVAPAMLEGILRVYANPDRPNEVSQQGMIGTSGVEHVIVRSTQKKNFEVLQPIDIDADAVYSRNAFGAEVEFTSQVATFDLEAVKRIASRDKKGEFFVVVIGNTGEEKKFKVKTKHFDRLP
ncbi:MAG: hypothetical protein BMS9Abin37_2617 [Acidobacteriota bacterium]|nr:MAG: hypothetical protein BMS9Abin37_2617 [Acidobacteriota bacterium]